MGSAPLSPPPSPQSSYTEHQPAEALRPYVQCYWTREATAPNETQPPHRVLPDGCMDIIFSLGGKEGERASVIGTMTTAIVIPDASASHYVSIRFRPGQAFHALGVPAVELTDRAVRLDDLWGDRRETLDRLLGARTLAERLRVLDAVLARRLLTRMRLDSVVDAAVDRIMRADGRVSVGALAESLGVTRQHLARRFAERVGVGPKVLARVMRMQGVVKRVTSEGVDDWSGLAYDFGYTDQSHLIGEFNELVGLTPGDYARRR
jgi:AraC-like DNA-binding protein